MEDPHLVNLSDRDIEDNEEMRRIVMRLANAASIPEIRHTMNIEDEIFSELESLDTTVLAQKKKIIAQGEQIAAQDEQIAAQGEQIAAQGEQIAAQGEQIAAQDEQIAAQGEQIAAAVRAFSGRGLQSAEIAEIMNLPQATVEEILNH